MIIFNLFIRILNELFMIRKKWLNCQFIKNTIFFKLKNLDITFLKEIHIPIEMSLKRNSDFPVI